MPWLSELKGQFGAFQADGDGSAVFERAEQDFIRQPVADLGLNHAGERPRAEERVVALLRQVGARLGLQGDGAPALRSLDVDADFSGDLLRRAARHLRDGDLSAPMAQAPG